MEPIILLIISLIIGSLFKGKEEQKPPSQKPSQSSRPDGTKRPNVQGGNLKDLTKQLYQDLQKEIQKESKENRTDPRPSKVETMEAEKPRTAGRMVDTTSASSEQEIAVTPRSPRSDRIRDVIKEPQSAPRKSGYSEVDQFFPESEEDLARAIVFSEILGPPKAKRR